MQSKFNKTHNDEIDLKEVLLILWKERFLIFIITLIFTILGFIYINKRTVVYQTSITFSDIPSLSLQKYKIDNLNIAYERRLAYEPNKKFRSNFLSIDNLILFYEQNKKIDEFKFFLKKKR